MQLLNVVDESRIAVHLVLVLLLLLFEALLLLVLLVDDLVDFGDV